MYGNNLLHSNQVVELFAQRRIGAEDASEIADIHVALVLHATHGLAGVHTLEDDGKALHLVVEGFAEHFDDVVGKTFLKLQTCRAVADNAGNLRNAEDAPIILWDVGEIVLAEERHHMMFAHRVEVAGVEDHLGVVCIVIKSGYLGFLSRIIATKEFSPHTDDTVGRIDQAFTLRVFANGSEHGTDGILQLFVSHR